MREERVFFKEFLPPPGGGIVEVGVEEEEKFEL
jgi:hypothetical protein